MSEIRWNCKSFDELTTNELYNILRLRSEIFVVEQQCIFLDMDDKDQQSYHVAGYVDDQLIAYARILPAGLSFAETSIGRVIAAKAARNSGAGRMLMEKSISHAKEIFGNQPIRIGAQLYLKKFYSSLGFNTVSDVYMEDGIEHIEMLLY
ncbi:GNAT family N-acetyltransferase [Pollutibacter soli]|uniref:GNAT family N-acetyltransferase n=1 Tax=Pollutibacter soli TaxID=3034157 RepID=UPI0030136880